MAVRQYIGARYVTKVYENSQDPLSAEWEPGVTWEPLIIVTYQNGSYMSKKPIPGNIGNPPANPEYWTQTGFYNGQIASLQEQVMEINGRLNDVDGNIDELFDDIADIRHNSKNLIGNLILNYNFAFATKGQLQGGCYVGNDRVVAYFGRTGNNTGILRCFNLSTYTVEWEHDIVGYHGNTITYNPENNCIYIAGESDNTDNSKINAIVIVDLDDPGNVVRTISLPDITECYSLAYDKDEKKFYSIAYSGTTAGVANMLYVFNEDLDELLDTIPLQHYPSVEFGLSSQGINLIRDGIAYIVTYSPKARAIYGYDIKTGKTVSISSIPSVINRCRSVGELEFVTYDDDTDSVLVGSVLLYTGVDGYHCFNLFEVDMFKGIVEICPNPGATLEDIEMQGRMREFNCIKAATGLKPAWWYNDAWLSVPNDAFIYSSHNNLPVWVSFAHSGTGIGSEQGTYLSALAIGNASVRVQGYADNDRLSVINFGAEEPCDLLFRFCTFKGYEVTRLASGYWANVYATNLARLNFNQCTMASYSASGSNRYHIIAYMMSEVKTNNVTLSGTVSTNYLNAQGGTITTS